MSDPIDELNSYVDGYAQVYKQMQGMDEAKQNKKKQKQKAKADR